MKRLFFKLSILIRDYLLWHSLPHMIQYIDNQMIVYGVHSSWIGGSCTPAISIDLGHSNKHSFCQMENVIGHVRDPIRLSALVAITDLGIGERWSDPLRHIYCKIKSSYSRASLVYILKVALEALNDNIGERFLDWLCIFLNFYPLFLLLELIYLTEENDGRYGVVFWHMKNFYYVACFWSKV